MTSNDDTLSTSTRSRFRSRSWMSTAVLAVLGAAITIASWVGGEPALALILGIFYLICCVGAYLWSRGHGDVAAIMALSGDERQRQIDVRATAVAGIATLGFCIGGTIVDLALGGTGNPWAAICAVGGISYALAVAVLIRRA